jgi:hypothetical protein
MHKYLLFTLGLLAAVPALAASLEVEVELPRFDVADYRRPYVAIWLERPDNSVAANLAVWYDAKMRNDEGSKWLKDMRQWWRRTGRTLELPIDGVTSATRHPGQHTLKLTAGQAPLGELRPASTACWSKPHANMEAANCSACRCNGRPPPMSAANCVASMNSAPSHCNCAPDRASTFKPRSPK